MRTCYTLLSILFLGFTAQAQVPWTPEPVPTSKLSAKQLKIALDQTNASIASTSCNDTVLYPQSKQTATANTVVMTGGFIEGVCQVYYNSDSVQIDGISFPSYLDTDFILGNTPSVTVIAAVYTMFKNYSNGSTKPGTLIDSVHYVITDNNNGTEIIMFNQPIITADSFVVVVDLDSAHIANGDTVYFLTNNSAANDGLQERLSSSLFSGLYYNNYNQIGGWDVDMYVNPIVSHTVTAQYTMSTSAICPGDTIDFTNVSRLNTGRKFNNFGGTNPLYEWDFGPAGTSTATSPSVQFNTSGTHTVKLKSTLYGSTGNCADSTMMTVYVSDSAFADFGWTMFGGIVQFHDSSSGATTYTWDFGDGSPLSNVREPLHTYTTNGAFEVCLIVSDSLACTSDTLCDSLMITQASIGEYDTDPAKIFPNPVMDVLSIRVANGDQVGNVTVFDVAGKVIYDNYHFGSTAIIPMAELRSGIYILERSDGQQKYRSKLLKQ